MLSGEREGNTKVHGDDMAVGGMPKLSSSSEVSDVHGEQSSGLLTQTRDPGRDLRWLKRHT